jgi:hypothetical protein
VGALSWVTFLPFSLLFGEISKNYGVDTAAWMITGVAVLTAAVLVKVVRAELDESVAAEAATEEDGVGDAVAEAESVPAVGALAA